MLAGFLLVGWTCSVAGYRTGGCSLGPEALLLVLAGLLAIVTTAMLRSYLRRRRLVARILESGQVEELRGTPARIPIPKEFRFQLCQFAKL